MNRSGRGGLADLDSLKRRISHAELKLMALEIAMEAALVHKFAAR